MLQHQRKHLRPNDVSDAEMYGALEAAFPHAEVHAHSGHEKDTEEDYVQGKYSVGDDVLVRELVRQVFDKNGRYTSPHTIPRKDSSALTVWSTMGRRLLH